ncbi:hypothetical protein CW736_13665 [Nonlabens sp. MB-3u-79]|jgi:hypothetical protein|uniref:DUF6588 family protein n=1 Tax=Nonlabens sp. MB-3u-79 TaxID=2058134 RepID=UPI000C3026BA|nr:DUF6588 family protein [Nonlabens sp. MB-3u-79]AUC80359.1 hypothetical protein CW736_13665 [Nonlabens sp. MB-3u-79]|tara:strand:- start:15073 stop:16071 length:999 start_codon:yes stop_codon:yes gene_type:complete
MKKHYLLVVLSLSFFCFQNTTAQNNDVENVLTDILFILDQYNDPAAEASVMQTGAGWFHTAKSLDKFKVNVAVGMSGLPFPKSKQNFSVRESDFINLDIRDGDQASIPTALGGQRRVFFDFMIDGETYEFQAFSGLNTDFFALPYIQGQIGLWKETEVSLRFVPQITIERSSYAIYGLGIKHNLSQYFYKEQRGFDLAFYTNYSLTDLNLGYDEPLDLEPSDGGAPLAIIDGSLIDFHSINAGLVASKDFNKWTLSSALNYNTSWVDYSLTGERSLFFDLFNNVLSTLSETKHSFKLDLGAAYQLTPKWNLNTQLSAGQFVNLNISGVYNIN